RLFRNKGIITEGSVGLARSFIMPLRAVIEHSLELLRDRQFAFLFGDGTSSPAVRDIMRKLQSQWSFPEGIFDELGALRESSPL
ncbi:MAG: hypothetical protein KAU28_00525, partial [Phycisphaerae bacterium]|nr:hypothetical protein [Phycisphaerae bacterium]